MFAGCQCGQAVYGQHDNIDLFGVRPLKDPLQVLQMIRTADPHDDVSRPDVHDLLGNIVGFRQPEFGYCCRLRGLPPLRFFRMAAI